VSDDLPVEVKEVAWEDIADSEAILTRAEGALFAARKMVSGAL
jgi:hypothetical protein